MLSIDRASLLLVLLPVLGFACKARRDLVMPALNKSDKLPADTVVAKSSVVDKAVDKSPVVDKAVTDAANTAIYEGKWKMPCIMDGDERLLITYEISKKSMIYSSEEFSKSDDNCLKSLKSVVAKGDFNLGKNIPEKTGVQEFDYTASSYLLTLHDASLVTSFNQNLFCGFSDWKIEVEKDLSKSECFMSKTQYSLIKVESNKLFWGRTTDQLDESTAAKRPTEIEAAVFAKKL
ncbi:MAG: hypothetical protein NTX25_18300 [Proteobacteria bacterium]|nr:hypothetical protein [Pseudomonadota bacterium]